MNFSENSKSIFNQKFFIMKKFSFAVLSVLIYTFSSLLFSCGSGQQQKSNIPGDTLSGSISMSGAFALYPVAVRWAEEFQKLHPNVRIDVSAGGAGKGMTDALTRMVDLGMFSKGISEEEKAKGAFGIAVTKDAVFPTFNAKNPYLKEILTKGLTKQKFYDIFVDSKLKTWGQVLGGSQKDPLHVFVRSDACGAAEMWAKYLNNQKQENLQGTGINGDPGIADAVRKDINGIGFNNLAFVYDISTKTKYEGLEIIPIDINENGIVDPEENFYGNSDSVIKAIKEGVYPSPPARNLYFISAGKPTNPLVIAFLNWVLSEGQKYVNEAGYVHLTDEALKAEIDKLK